MKKIVITRAQARRYLLRHHHLTEDTRLSGADAVVDYVRKVGCIQYDPLDVVGRNPDLVLQARVAGYRKGDIGTLLYGEKRLFDVWDKNMSICAVGDWPYFSRFRERFRPRCEAFAPAIGHITRYLKENGSACSSDFELEERVDWHYGPQRLAKAALECMCYAGLAVVHHKKGTRRYYCLAEDFVPPHLVAADDLNRSDRDYRAWQVLRRINGIGLLWNRGGDAWLGLRDFKSADRAEGFDALLKKKRIVPVETEGLSSPLYLDRENLPLLEACRDEPASDGEVRIMAPLDNMLWDRKLLAGLFDFDYKWEVYVPQSKRKYGYYVLPVLCGERFVGRIEMRTEKSTRTLVVQSFHPEPDVPATTHALAINKEIRRFENYNLCEKTVRECRL